MSAVRALSLMRPSLCHSMKSSRTAVFCVLPRTNYYIRMLPRKRRRIADLSVRVTAPVVTATPAAVPDPSNGTDVRELQTVRRIEEHLTRIFKQDREQSSRSSSTGRNAQQRASLQLKLLPTHMTVEGPQLVLPYSKENQRLLRTLEQGRIPWDELRRHPALQALCESKYTDGSLSAEMQDLRAPEHSVLGLETRLLMLHPTDDDLMQVGACPLGPDVASTRNDPRRSTRAARIWRRWS